MNTIKCINQIIPCNEIFHRYCFYSYLFSIIRGFQGDILPLLLNEVPFYNYTNDDIHQFSISYKQERSIEDVLLSMGIKIYSYKFKGQLVADIYNSILAERPVIISVDSFFEPTRIDTYHKTHWKAMVLIYGYDMQQQCMQIIENKHKDIPFYENHTLNNDDLVSAYKGYYMNFCRSNQAMGYFEFEKETVHKPGVVDNTYMCEYRKLYTQNLKSNQKTYIEGLDCLKNFVENMSRILIDEKELNCNLDRLITSLNNIINTKKSELYKITRILGENNYIVKKQNDCLNSWNIVRAIVVKYKFSGVYRKEKFTALVDGIYDIYNIESTYFESFLS